MSWQYGLAIGALSLACAWMAWEDWRRRRFFGPLYFAASAACLPWMLTLGWYGWLVGGYSLALVGVGLLMARAGVWGSGDALALGTVALQPTVLVLAAACSAVAVAAWRAGRGPGPSRFAAFWLAAEGAPPGRPRLPFATVLGASALVFLLLEALAA